VTFFMLLPGLLGISVKSCKAAWRLLALQLAGNSFHCLLDLFRIT
jgi:hypothetical protein